MTCSVTLSVEIELGWGFHDIADPYDVAELSEDGEREREALKWLLKRCDEAGVRLTFDVVGHLLLETCDGEHEGPHEEGWFDRDPGSDATSDPLYYFPELVDFIDEAEVNHEVCTHTFSHVLCDEITDEVLEWEIQRSREHHEEDFVSLVPPRHREPSKSVLRENGIDVVRLADERHPPSNPVTQYLWTLRRSHHPQAVCEVDGVVETRTTPLMNLTASHLSRGVSGPHPSFRVLPLRLRQRSHEMYLKKGLEEAIARDSHIHYWTHLYNFAHHAQQPPVESLLQELGNSEEAEVKRMMDLSA